MIKKLWAHRLVGFAMFLGVAFGSGGMYYYTKKNFIPVVYNLEEVVTQVDTSVSDKDIKHSPFSTDTRTWYVTSAELLTIRENSWHSRMVKVKVFTDAKVFVCFGKDDADNVTCFVHTKDGDVDSFNGNLAEELKS